MPRPGGAFQRPLIAMGRSRSLCHPYRAPAARPTRRPAHHAARSTRTSWARSSTRAPRCTSCRGPRAGPWGRTSAPSSWTWRPWPDFAHRPAAHAPRAAARPRRPDLHGRPAVSGAVLRFQPQPRCPRCGLHGQPADVSRTCPAVVATRARRRPCSSARATAGGRSRGRATASGTRRSWVERRAQGGRGRRCGARAARRPLPCRRHPRDGRAVAPAKAARLPDRGVRPGRRLPCLRRAAGPGRGRDEPEGVRGVAPLLPAGDPAIKHYDTAPLGEFQTRWTTKP